MLENADTWPLRVPRKMRLLHPVSPLSAKVIMANHWATAHWIGVKAANKGHENKQISLAMEERVQFPVECWCSRPGILLYLACPPVDAVPLRKTLKFPWDETWHKERDRASAKITGWEEGCWDIVERAWKQVGGEKGRGWKCVLELRKETNCQVWWNKSWMGMFSDDRRSPENSNNDCLFRIVI